MITNLRRKDTPNLFELVMHRFSVICVPPNTGLNAAIDCIRNNELAANWKAARVWAEGALAEVRAASDPNPWRNSTDEEIATFIMERVNAKRAMITGSFIRAEMLNALRIEQYWRKYFVEVCKRAYPPQMMSLNDVMNFILWLEANEVFKSEQVRDVLLKTLDKWEQERKDREPR